jgi:hypothetical protein
MAFYLEVDGENTCRGGGFEWNSSIYAVPELLH